ncbi:MAG: hypothetical protein KC478_07600 [Bacteriovoracaceae bacterium]|nr:hypothetical protein [Bacteriovoracaceae bacterium]
MLADSTNKNLNNFEVALLIEDIHEAKEVSDALRELGIYAHYYSDLDEFWVAANAETPEFLIIDVKRMSQGSLLFKNHPKVKNNTLRFSFYYSKSSQILVNSTFGLSHYGLISSELDMVGQIRSVLTKRGQEIEALQEKQKLEQRIERLQNRSNRVLKEANQSFNYQKQFEHLMSVTSRLGQPKTQQEFVSNLMSLMSEWGECQKYGIYTLNQTDQKLVSPKFIKPNYEQLPELWLTRSGDTGIEDYAQEMACEVAFDLMENNARAIFVKGVRKNPEMIIVANFDEKSMEGFAWELFEERLSHCLSQLQFRENNTSRAANTDLSVWEAFNYLDDIHFHQAKGNHKLADVNLSNLLEKVKERSGNRFYWKAFCADFVSELESTLSGDFKISMYGAQSFMVFIDKRFLEQDYQKLKAMADDFQYWRYFQDASTVMTSGLAPDIRLIAPSSVNFMRQMNGRSLNNTTPSDYSTDEVQRPTRSAPRERTLDA